MKLPRERRRIAIALVLMALMLAMLGWQLSQPRGIAPAQTPEAVDEAERAANPDVEEKEQTSRPARLQVAESSPPEHPAGGEEVAKQAENVLVIEFVTHAGEPVPGVRSEVLRFVNLIGGGEVRENFEAIADDSGRLAISRHRLPHIKVRLLSKEWQAVERSEGRPSLMIDGDGWITPWGREIVLERLKSLGVAVRYSDGVPYTGTISTTIGDPDSFIGTKHSTFDVVDGTVEFRAAVGQPFHVSIASRRPGFGAAGVTAEGDEPFPDGVEVVLPRSDSDQGAIEIDLAAFDPKDELYLWINSTPSPLASRYTVQTNGGGTHAILREPGDYLIHVREILPGAKNPGALPQGAEPASQRLWGSEPVTVHPRETTRIVVLPQTASAVRARIVNDRGEIQVPGRVFVEGDIKRAIDWREATERNYILEDGIVKSRRWAPGFANLDGVATAMSVLPGKRLIGVDAPGCDIGFFEVDCQPGEVLDLGTVALAPASGVIEVEVSNWEPSLTYTAKLNPWAMAPRDAPVIELVDGRGRFENLQRRWYQVAVKTEQRATTPRTLAALLSDDLPRTKLMFELQPAPQRND